ncbi:MAG: hypothetical protein V4547_03915 [Bacteroidota bacterium]
MNEDQFENLEPTIKSNNKTKASFDKSPEIAGKIAGTIGTGRNAKNSLIYLTIRWAFISGTIISILVVCNNWLFRTNEKVPDFTSDIINTWSIVIPVITLALGYAFGKSEK